MKLYIKQKVFSWKDRFTVKDINGNDRYYVEGELFSVGKRLHIYNSQNEEVAMIVQKLWSFLPRYFVYVNGVQTAQIVKEFTFLKQKYRIEGPDWEVAGDFSAHEYTVTQNGTPVVGISKEWMTWGDSYVLEMADTANEILALSVVLAVDCVMATSSSSN